ncbi:MAG: translation initiation factor IF-1 [Verrucomicrobiae bacterium]|nr:translation initiation factor IF-1 [Verrucomicrobiae bacterium]MCX7722127.1 translation initiation factor IF-1 [Verrucomicrobiae bacterium]MDW7979392.1 translation initiation factor IF-1 [Verrucomicrobiales bacterium]
MQTLPNGTCKVELPNGHQLIGWGAARAGLTELAPGKKVLLEVSPFDLSHGRLVALIED